MGGDLLHSVGYNIIIKGLNPNYLAKSIYGCKVHLCSLHESEQKQSKDAL